SRHRTHQDLPLSLHDALPISQPVQAQSKAMKAAVQKTPAAAGTAVPPKNAAAPKGAAAHTESAKPGKPDNGKPDNRKDAKGHERSEEHTSELQSLRHLVCRLL